MTDILFSTVFRYAPKESAGELVRFNWEKKETIESVPIYPRVLQFEDPNPRGGSRGGKGIAVLNNKIIVCSYCELQVYDFQFNYMYSITNPLMAGLHEIYLVDNNKIWVTSTTIDTAILIDLKTGQSLQQFWPREMCEFQEKWGIEPLPINKELDNRLSYINMKFRKLPGHLHFNAISMWHGQVYGLFNLLGAVVNLSTRKIIIENPDLIGAHNLYILNDGTFFVNDTRNHGIFHIDMNGTIIKRINLLPFHPARKRVHFQRKIKSIRTVFTKLGFMKHPIADPFFVRGMDIIDEKIFIGISPASILCLNWKTEELLGIFNYSKDDRIAVHGLKILK